MARSQSRSKRKYTGKKYKYFRKKRKRELERPPMNTQIGSDKVKIQRVMGGNSKVKLFSTNYVNLTDPNTNKTQKVRIMRFESNQASKDINRRHILTKGAIIETELGKARITSRPGQQGQLNAVLI